MKTSHSSLSSSKGFSLIEVIATIILVGILAAFFVQFMGTAQNKSWKSVELVADEAESEAMLEEIIAYFTSQINHDPDHALDNVDAKYSGDHVTMQYVVFQDGNENILEPGNQSINLKVTINLSGNALTTMLTKSRTRNEDPSVKY